MFCHKCGNIITENAAFCQKCGTKLMDNNIVSQATDVPVSVVAQGDAGISRGGNELLKALIGKNSDYYLKQFDKIDRGEKSFNWYAFFFAPILLLYRKQFAYFAKMLLPGYALLFIQMLLAGYATATFSLELMGIIPFTGLIIVVYTIVMSILCGKGFNKHYKTQLQAAIAGKQLKIADESAIKKLKPSVLIPILFVTLSFVLSSALNVLVVNIATESLLSGYKEAVPEQATTAVPSQANKTPREVLYKGKTITNWIGARPRQKSLQDEFGALVATGKARGGDYRRYDGITFFINVQRDEIVSIGGTNLELFTVNGVSLDKDRAGLIRIFGNPQKEGQVMGGDDEGSYYMAYDYMGYSLAFYRSSRNGKVEWFEISNKKE
ncbi:zinc ribbon domain-containing protein [Pelosinus propionicus]|uniref:Zinc-ribbon domain-containing protein n=1 Tax=Pelosinus propionicus DSM 13327 TaxID=1123291 RepID=A0A1I4M4F3_9FIRM|nr:zinc ribbon domain-containing protein [Pelosinus propionicus]SFL98111.1 Protein of unknown function [Pelosinus propionicus DSM 13327]